MTTHTHTHRQQNVISEASAWAVVQFLTWVSQQQQQQQKKKTNAKQKTNNRWVWVLSVCLRVCVCIGKPQEHQLMADKLNFAVLNGQSMRRTSWVSQVRVRSALFCTIENS